MTIANPSHATLSSLADLRWESRIIAVFVEYGSAEQAELQDWVDKNSCRLAERDTLVATINQSVNQPLSKQAVAFDTATIQLLTDQRRFDNSEFEMLLIGKDGGIKARSHQVADLEDFITRIDGMPMRQQEARRVQSRC